MDLCKCDFPLLFHTDRKWITVPSPTGFYREDVSITMVSWTIMGGIRLHKFRLSSRSHGNSVFDSLPHIKKWKSVPVILQGISIQHQWCSFRLNLESQSTFSSMLLVLVGSYRELKCLWAWDERLTSSRTNGVSGRLDSGKQHWEKTIVICHG